MSRPYTRVTLAGGSRNVELVLPSDTPIGSLMPEMLARFEPASALDPTIKTLTVDGLGSLPWSRSLADSAVVDGAVLRITDRVDAYPSPIVYDLVDEAAAVRPSGPAWPHGRARTLAATGLAAVLAFCAANLLTLPLSPASASWTLVAVALLLALVAGALDNRRVGLGLPLLTLSATLAIAGALVTQGPLGIPGWGLVPLGCLLGLAWFAANRNWRHLALAAAAMALLGAAWVLLVGWLGAGPHAGAVLAVVTMVLLGYLPRLAITVTGLATLDDRALRGEPLARPRAVEAMDAAHQGLVAAVALCALSTWGSVWLLANSWRLGGWALGLALLVIALTALRARSYPLVVQRFALLVGAGLAAVTLGTRFLVTHPQSLWSVGGLLALLALVALLAPLLRLPDHSWAQLRLLAGRLETLLTVALVPVAVGLFGIYGELATVFQR